MFITSSNLVGRSTGRSAGFAPLSMRSTQPGTRRWRSRICRQALARRRSRCAPGNSDRKVRASPSQPWPRQARIARRRVADYRGPRCVASSRQTALRFTGSSHQRATMRQYYRRHTSPVYARFWPLSDGRKSTRSRRLRCRYPARADGTRSRWCGSV